MSQPPRPPAHAQPSVLAALGRLRRTDAVTVLVLAVALLVFLATRGYRPDTASAAATHGGTAGKVQSAADPGKALAGAEFVGGGSGGDQARRAFAALGTLAPASSLAADGIPTTALAAYQGAAAREGTIDPGCGITWPLLAAIGRVESDHGRFAGAVLHTDGLSTPQIIGIPLDGHGTALIRDTDGGRLDGDTVFDRAVGPMQFIPSTWATHGVDADGDGVANPFDIFDAAAAAADYLCAAGGDLTTAAGQRRAVLAYNHSAAYVADVLALEAVYAQGVPGHTVAIVPTAPSDLATPAPTRSSPAPPGRSAPARSTPAGSSSGPAGGPPPSSSPGTPPTSPTTGAPTCPVSPTPTNTTTNTTADPTNTTTGPTAEPTPTTPTPTPTGPTPTDRTTGPTGSPSQSPTGPCDTATSSPSPTGSGSGSGQTVRAE